MTEIFILLYFNIYRFCLGTSPYDSRICIQENNGNDTSNSQNVKGEEELSRVYQTLTLPTLSREETNSSNNHNNNR